LYAEISINMPKDSNLISMSEKYLGKFGKIFCWFVYLFLFYCLSVAYLSGGGKIVQGFFEFLPINFTIVLFLIFLASFIYFGAKAVDRLNILLVIGLIVSYFLFIYFGAKDLNFKNFYFFDIKHSFISFPIILLSFGFQGIMPSLTYYMNKDYKKIRLAILLGTFMAFFVYLIFELLILGIVPIEGPFGLKDAFNKGYNAIIPLKHFTKVNILYYIGQFFSFFAITTSYLGVNLGFFDFIADGLKLPKKGFKKLLIALLTFIPPLIISLINPNLFLKALNYAGGFGGVLLLILLPALMVWSSRYFKNEINSVKVVGGKPVLLLIMLFSLFIISIGFINF